MRWGVCACLVAGGVPVPVWWWPGDPCPLDGGRGLRTRLTAGGASVPVWWWPGDPCLVGGGLGIGARLTARGAGAPAGVPAHLSGSAAQGLGKRPQVAYEEFGLLEGGEVTALVE